MARLQHRPPTKDKDVVARAAPTGEPPVAEHTPTFIEPERRHAMICEAAYFLAEQRGFCPGREVEDWLLAEREIDHALTASMPATQVDI